MGKRVADMTPEELEKHREYHRNYARGRKLSDEARRKKHARNADWAKRNPEKVKGYRTPYAALSDDRKQQQRDRVRQWAVDNRDKKRAKDRRYYAKHTDKIRDYHREYERDPAGQHAAYLRWKENNPDKYLAGYIRKNLLSLGYLLPDAPEQVEAYVQKSLNRRLERKTK